MADEAEPHILAQCGRGKVGDYFFFLSLRSLFLCDTAELLFMMCRKGFLQQRLSNATFPRSLDAMFLQTGLNVLESILFPSGMFLQLGVQDLLEET